MPAFIKILFHAKTSRRHLTHIDPLLDRQPARDTAPSLGQLQEHSKQCIKKLVPKSSPMNILAAIPLSLALLVMASSAHAERDQAAEPDPVSQLKKIDHYAFGGIGFAGTTSQGEKLYNEVMQRATATDDFADIADTGTPEAKMYALHALARRSPEKYRQLKKSAKRNQKVATIQGCLAGESTVGTLLDEIEEQLQRDKGTE